LLAVKDRSDAWKLTYACPCKDLPCYGAVEIVRVIIIIIIIIIIAA